MMSLHSPLSKTQLGVAVPALALPREGAGGDGDATADRQPEPTLLFFGIVDFLQVCKGAWLGSTAVGDLASLPSCICFLLVSRACAV